jgi:deazaflavin-dependent oxidoreductase (nitroreductase family)
MVQSKPPARLVKLTSPLARQLAGRRWLPLWAVVRHRGRRTGREYSIPVAVLVTPDTFVIGLPWGPDTNWAQNVLAAKGCTIRWKAVDYRVTDPQLVGTDVALRVARRFERVVIRRFNFLAFLQLQRCTP